MTNTVCYPFFFKYKMHSTPIALILRESNDSIASLEGSQMIQSLARSFAILVEPHRNVKVAFKVGLWPFNSMNIIWKHNDFNLTSFLP